MGAKDAVKEVFSGWFKKAESTEVMAEEAGTEGGEESHGSRQAISLSGQSDSAASSSRSFGIGAGTVNLHDPAYEQAVRDEIEKANLPGTDYFEYTAAVNAAMTEDRQSEETAFISVFKTLCRTDKMFGLDVLMTSSDNYIGVAQTFLDRFVRDSNKIVDDTQKDLDVYLRDIKKPLDAMKDRDAAAELLKSNTDSVAAIMEGVKVQQQNRQAKVRYQVELVVNNLRNDQARIQKHLAKTPTTQA